MYVKTIRPGAMKVWPRPLRGLGRFFRSQIVLLRNFTTWKFLVRIKVKNIALSVLRWHLTFALESLTFFTITTFRTFYHSSVICEKI